MGTVQELRQKLAEAIKSQDKYLNAIRFVLSEVTANEVRRGKALTDEEVHGIVYKAISNNKEVMRERFTDKTDPKYVALSEENLFLAKLAPATLTDTEIESELSPVVSDIASARDEKHAMGVAMKYLKARPVRLIGEDVREVVVRLRK